MNMNMYVYRMTEKPDSESAGETGEPKAPVVTCVSELWAP